MLDLPPMVGGLLGHGRSWIEEFDGALIESAAHAPACALMKQAGVILEVRGDSLDGGIHPGLHLGEPQARFRHSLVPVAHPRRHGYRCAAVVLEPSFYSGKDFFRADDMAELREEGTFDGGGKAHIAPGRQRLLIGLLCMPLAA